MANRHATVTTNDELLPRHDLLTRILSPKKSNSKAHFLPISGTMQSFNQNLATWPLLDFVNYTLRGIGQVIFVNNPVSGLLILVALFIQSPWVGTMGLVGVIASTLTALLLKLDRDAIRNGIFGYNGILVGAALAIFGLPGNGSWNPAWIMAVIFGAALTTLLMKPLGFWLVTKFKAPPLTLPFNIVTWLFLGAVLFLPQPYFNLGPSAPLQLSAGPLDWFQIAKSLPIAFGQVFLADNLVAGILIFLSVAICTPIGAGVGLLGAMLGILAGLIVGIAPETLYAGLWGYNALLTAMAIGGLFYAPTGRSILIGLLCAFLSALVGGLLSILLSPLGLPILTVPFCIATIGGFVLVQRSLPSLMPVALHAVTSPEEHWQRYLAAKEVITNFRRQLEAAMSGKRRRFLLEKASSSMKDDLRSLFDSIDTNRNGTLSEEEIAEHLQGVDQDLSSDEVAYLFTSMDLDGNGEIDFEEFSELILRYQHLMSRYEKFMTYFWPINANGNKVISIEEINIAMSSVGEAPLSADAAAFLQAQTGGLPLTWRQFI